ALIEWVPTGNAAVWNEAIPAVTPAVARALPFSNSCTCPVGVPPVTVAEKLNVLPDPTLAFVTVSLVDVAKGPPPPPPPPLPPQPNARVRRHSTLKPNAIRD